MTYTCDIGGINEIKNQAGRHTVDGQCAPNGTFIDPPEFAPPVTVECVASYTW